MLEGKVAVVTGAASGIGRGIAGGLAAAGADVVAIDVTEDAADGLLSELTQLGAPSPSFVTLDVRDPARIRSAFAEIGKARERIDVLVNSAGVPEISDPLELEPSEWENVIAVDLSGTFYCCQAAAKEMIRSAAGGSLINIASVAGLIGISGRVAYTAAKHGVVGITKTLARDLAPHRIRVNALCPGLVRTPLNEQYFADEEFVRSVARLVPLGTYGQPSHIAQVAVFLASEMSSYVTGIALPVDGGWLAEKSYSSSDDPNLAFNRRVRSTEAP
jgi:NAD(P)-dependent dehydrogenase (short-subunit alcohol dehydrogenase family)